VLQVGGLRHRVDGSIFLKKRKMFHGNHRTMLTAWNQLRRLDVHGSVHYNLNLIERTNKMQPCSRIYYSNVP